MKQHPRVEAMPRTIAAHTIKYYVCAGCWSNLIIQPDKDNPQLDWVLCPNCETPGYISKSATSKIEQESIMEAINVKHNLRDAVPFLHPGGRKTAEEIIKSLGF